MFLKPNWPIAPSIQAYTTLRIGGFSQAPFDQFNLAYHVLDHSNHVKQNRELLKKQLQLPDEPIWLQQTHSTIAVPALPENRECEADASFADQAHQICVVLTADCLPILLCNKAGTHVAAIHAGWRGLCHGIIEATLEQLPCLPHEWLVWLGPAITANYYEVGDEVREQFIELHPNAEQGFTPSTNQRWLADLYTLARMRFIQLGIPPSAIYSSNDCTYANSEKFYSYRRDGGRTGRMASLIWISDSD